MSLMRPGEIYPSRALELLPRCALKGLALHTTQENFSHAPLATLYRPMRFKFIALKF
jgi:hypothetical protein